jgi:hypothetical protein
MRCAGLILLLFLCAEIAMAQAGATLPQSAPVRSDPPQPAAPAVTDSEALDSQPVILGEPSADLTKPWKFHTGDNMDWARADLDDSGWKTIDLAKGVGWTKLGYAGYSGFAWYRLRVNVQGAKHGLALQMPENADDAYQVYVNGQLVGQFGKFSGSKVTAYSALPLAFPFPRGVGNGTVSIAIRMWMDRATLFNSPDAGGLHDPPTLGYNSLITKLIQLEYDAITRFFVGTYPELLILLIFLPISGVLFWFDREEKPYLWLALVCAVTLVYLVVILSVNYTAWLDQTVAVFLADVVLAPVRLGLWVLFWGYWFRIAKISRLHQVVWLLVALLIVGTAMLRPPFYGVVVPANYSSVLLPFTLVLRLALGVLLLLVAYWGIRTQKTEGWLAASAVLLVFVATHSLELRMVRVPTMFSVLDFQMSLGTLSAIGSLIIYTVMLLRRFAMAQALKEQWKIEIQQAQEVQQLLIPAELPAVMGITIESEYRPAREVGGDFFQILPLELPGSVLIVVGDVTGKGMQAGMLVALIVGAIRGMLTYTTDPAQILKELNEQLCERENAIATCLILRIDPDGTGVIANAGQLSPCVNGVEIEMEGTFPIGIVPDADSAIASFALKDGDKLFLMSDGVVEATALDGELFGFERIAELLNRRASSAEIALAAQQFGQKDDILVLQVRRDANPILEWA